MLGYQPAHSGCTNEIRQALLDKKIGFGRIGSSDTIQGFIERRLLTYKRKAQLTIGFRVKDFELNSQKSNYLAERLIETISLKKMPEKINDLLEHYWKNNNLIHFHQKWLSGLYKEVIFSTYAKSNSKLLEKFETELKVPEKILVEVILNRLKDTGLDSKSPERLWTALSPSNFSELLIDRKVIIDETFRGKPHGHLTHLLHMDLLRFVAIDRGISTRVVGDTIEFIGRNKKIPVEDFYFQPLEGIWDVLFDSWENDFSRPEIFNIGLETFFGYKRF